MEMAGHGKAWIKPWPCDHPFAVDGALESLMSRGLVDDHGVTARGMMVVGQLVAARRRRGTILRRSRRQWRRHGDITVTTYTRDGVTRFVI
jgi:hypothetical protein